MLIKRRRVEVDATAANFLNPFLQSRNISVQSIFPEIAELSVNFGDPINKNPADRIIAATSTILNAQRVTADENLQESHMLETIWCPTRCGSFQDSCPTLPQAGALKSSQWT